MTQEGVVGIAWYRPEDWVALKSILIDADKLQDSYQEWLKHAQEVQQQMQREGHVVNRVRIDPKTFPGWCTLRGLRPDAAARSEYASEIARLELGGKTA